MQTVSTTTLTGGIIALIGSIATFCAIFGIVIPTSELSLIVSSGIALYGAIHQIIVTYSANKVGVTKGVMVKK